MRTYIRAKHVMFRINICARTRSMLVVSSPGAGKVEECISIIETAFAAQDNIYVSIDHKDVRAGDGRRNGQVSKRQDSGIGNFPRISSNQFTFPTSRELSGKLQIVFICFRVSDRIERRSLAYVVPFRLPRCR